MAAIELEGIFQIVQPLAGGLVAAVDDPAIGMQKCRRSEIAIPVPPVGRAGRRAGRAHHAFVEPVELLAVVDRLLPFLGRAVGLGLQPRHDAGVLGIEMRQIRDQILDHRHVRQRIDLHVALDLLHSIKAGQRVDPVDIHRAGATDAFAAGPAEGQGRIDLVLDLDQRVQNHRPAGIHVDEIGVDTGVLSVIGVPAIDLELADIGGPFGFGPRLAGADRGVLGKRELNHVLTPIWARPEGRKN